MRKLQVYVELSGKQVHVGNIHGNGPDDACIEYDKKYIETQGAMPISLSLPFLNQEYDSEKTKYFLKVCCRKDLPEDVWLNGCMWKNGYFCTA